ncbi:MAG: sigma-70 family RNA polymerase sigma factor [bacterium]|nr:sigma-70 family RNA polymerase sigma factor [bacterium]
MIAVIEHGQNSASVLNSADYDNADAPSQLETLLKRAQAGHEPAQEALFDAYYARVTAFIRRYVDANEAEDVAQEVFVKTFRSLERLREPKAFEGYLFTAAKNSCMSWLRKKMRMRRMMDVLWRAASSWNEASSFKPTMGLDGLDSLIQQLPEDSQHYLKMFYIEKRSRSEIAEMMNESNSSAYRKINAARVLLLKAAEQQGSRIEFSGRHDIIVSST